MGRKSIRKRKHFFFYLTCIIIILHIVGISGCTLLKANYMLLETQELITKGNYKTALEQNEQILKEYPQMGDSALFKMGLIYAHPKNAGKNYEKSLHYFIRLMKEYPDSNLNTKAQIYISLLKKIIKLNKNNKLKRVEISNLKEKIASLKEKYDTLTKETEEKDKKIQEKDKKSDELQQQIEKLKEIDLSIQKKKINVNKK